MGGSFMGNIKILAFDPGTANLGYAALTGTIQNSLSSSEVHLAKYFGVLKTSKWADTKEVLLSDRLDILGTMTKKLINEVKPDYIAMEDFTEQGKRVGKTYKEMAYLTEHLRLLARSLNTEATIYTNACWKKQTLKTGHASKIQVKHYVSNMIPEAANVLKNQPDHVWDSVGIAYCKWLEILNINFNQGGI
jgi:Holliday junction resolvasome RuvABC endonuclease subunit